MSHQHHVRENASSGACASRPSAALATTVHPSPELLLHHRRRPGAEHLVSSASRPNRLLGAFPPRPATGSGHGWRPPGRRASAVKGPPTTTLLAPASPAARSCPRVAARRASVGSKPPPSRGPTNHCPPPPPLCRTSTRSRLSMACRPTLVRRLLPTRKPPSPGRRSCAFPLCVLQPNRHPRFRRNLAVPLTTRRARLTTESSAWKAQVDYRWLAPSRVAFPTMAIVLTPGGPARPPRPLPAGRPQVHLMAVNVWPTRRGKLVGHWRPLRSPCTLAISWARQGPATARCSRQQFPPPPEAPGDVLAGPYGCAPRGVCPPVPAPACLGCGSTGTPPVFGKMRRTRRSPGRKHRSTPGGDRLGRFGVDEVINRPRGLVPLLQVSRRPDETGGDQLQAYEPSGLIRTA